MQTNLNDAYTEGLITAESFVTEDGWTSYRLAMRKFLAQHPVFMAHRLPRFLRWVPRHKRVAIIIGGTEDPYMVRWHIIPRNRWFNIYVHLFLRSDDDRAQHDHPWSNVSILLSGSYIEHRPDGVFLRKAGHAYAREATQLHRVELIKHEPVWTLFITGPKVREWGFACPQGWRFWKDFSGVDAQGNNDGTVGKGCGE